MKTKIFISTALLMSAYFLQSCGNSNTSADKNVMDSSMTNMAQHDSMSSGKMEMDNGMMQSMSSSMDNMKNMKMTGDFDHDFASMMMVHHQGAIDMAQMEISKGSNAEMKSMAEKMVKAQQAEITQFNNMLKDYKIPEIKKEGAEPHNELAEGMDKMYASMKGVAMTGNTDKDFAMMMIPHHETAVTMAENEISHGKNLALKKMAQKIIEDQTKEIKDLQDWLAKNK